MAEGMLLMLLTGRVLPRMRRLNACLSKSNVEQRKRKGHADVVKGGSRCPLGQKH